MLQQGSALEGQLAVRLLDILLAGIVRHAQCFPGVQAARNAALSPLHKGRPCSSLDPTANNTVRVLL